MPIYPCTMISNITDIIKDINEFVGLRMYFREKWKLDLFPYKPKFCDLGMIYAINCLYMVTDIK